MSFLFMSFAKTYSCVAICGSKMHVCVECMICITNGKDVKDENEYILTEHEMHGPFETD